jgi:5'-3' exonuclease
MSGIEFDENVFDGHILMIDLTNLAVQGAFAVTYRHPEDNRVWSRWKSRFLGNIIEFVDMFKADRLILAMDSTDYWRKDIFPEYKLGRKAFKDKCKIDYDNFNNFYYSFMELVTPLFTSAYTIKMNKCEADDVIAVLTKFHSPDSKITVLSSDKDYNQLLKYPNVKKYDQLQRKYITSLNPVVELETKIICGDKNDFIPSIGPRIGPKTAEDMIRDQVCIMESSDASLVANYKRNRTLIDFEFIPQNITDSILNWYKSHQIIASSNKKIFDFLMDHAPDDGIMKWQLFGNSFLKLR